MFSSHPRSRKQLRYPHRRVFPSALVCICLLATTAVACQVPVFRYALERWSSDRYPLLIVSRGSLASLDESLLRLLDTGEPATASVELKRINLDSNSDPQLEQLWHKHAQNKQPLLVALYPNRSALRKQVAHVCELTESNIRGLLDSPARQQIVRNLISGDSAVWILVESGDEAKDQLAKDTLSKQLAAEQKLISLPTAEELETTPAALAEVKIKLKIGFSVVSLSRKDPREKMLLDCLLNSEPDLADFSDQPIAFPVFGRGIVLYAIVGKGINPAVIHSACAFITGPCSCQAKEQNPGFDLLLNLDWKTVIGDRLISQPANIGSSSEPKLLTIPPGKQK